MTIEITKVITCYLQYEEIEEINKITGVEDFTTDFWFNTEFFEEIYPELKNFVSNEELQALKNGDVDYIVFRTDI